MSSDDYGQVTTIVQRLRELQAMLNPIAVVDLVADAARETAVPPPGDPDELESLAQVYRKAADDIAPVGADVRKIGTNRLPEAWRGGAATDAAAVVTATADAVDGTPTALRDAAQVLTELSGEVREQQRKHADLHQGLRDAANDATHVMGLPIPDPSALDDLVRAAAGLISGCIDVYTASLDAGDRAAARFADIAGRARAATAVEGGLAADDAVVLAAEKVKIPGIGDDYDDGVLNPAQLKLAGERLADLDRADRAKFDDLMNKAGSDTERAWLLKALAAGRSPDELSGFADKIRGKDHAWLDEHLSLIDRGGTGQQSRFSVDIDQFDNTTCGTTSLIVARAEADPLYALSLTEGDPAKFDERLTAEQRRTHDETNKVWPEAVGTSPMGMADYMNKYPGNNGAEYDWHLVDDTDNREISSRMREVVSAADQGHPVPVLVGGEIPRHYVLVVGHSGGDVLIFEPTSGETRSVPESDFLNGKLGDEAGFDHVQAVITPK